MRIYRAGLKVRTDDENENQKLYDNPAAALTMPGKRERSAVEYKYKDDKKTQGARNDGRNWV